MLKKSHHFLTLWPWPLTYDLEKLIRSGHHHYQCVYQIWEQSIPWFLSYLVNTIAGGGRRVAGGRRLRRKTITSPDPSDTGDIIILPHLSGANELITFNLSTSKFMSNDTCENSNWAAQTSIFIEIISILCMHEWVTTGSDNGLLPAAIDTKPLITAMLTYWMTDIQWIYCWI